MAKRYLNSERSYWFNSSWFVAYIYLNHKYQQKAYWDQWDHWNHFLDHPDQDSGHYEAPTIPKS